MKEIVIDKRSNILHHIFLWNNLCVQNIGIAAPRLAHVACFLLHKISRFIIEIETIDSATSTIQFGRLAEKNNYLRTNAKNNRKIRMTLILRRAKKHSSHIMEINIFSLGNITIMSPPKTKKKIMQMQRHWIE